MGRPKPHAYGVRLSKMFERQVEDIFRTWERWDEVSESLHRDVPLRPEAFPIVPGTGFRAATIETNPPHTVYFEINDAEEVLDFVGLL